MGDPFRETTKPMPHRDAAETAAEHLKRRVLLTILALSWMGSGLAWILVERRGLSSDVLRVVFGLNAVFHPAMAATVWRRLLPVQAVELSCLFFASIICGACMALRFYGGPTTANIALEPLYLWIPVIYVFAFTLPNRRLSLTIALAILALFVAISLPWLVRHVAEPEGNFTIQMHFVSGVLIAALYLFSSYLHNFQTAQLTVDELARLANTDELTKLANRRRMTEAIEYELVRYSRYGHPFSVIVLDLDHFKSINDRFGHRVGDDSLVALASRTTEALRDVDMLGRWGGEEFIVVLPETRFDETLRKASSLCQHVAATPLVGEHATTISCGVTSVIRGDTVETLLQRADVALYEAKRRGRNRAEGVRTTTDAQALVTS